MPDIPVIGSFYFWTIRAEQTDTGNDDIGSHMNGGIHSDGGLVRQYLTVDIIFAVDFMLCAKYDRALGYADISAGY